VAVPLVVTPCALCRQRQAVFLVRTYRGGLCSPCAEREAERLLGEISIAATSSFLMGATREERMG